MRWLKTLLAKIRRESNPSAVPVWDPSKLCCLPSEKAALEARNGVVQLDYISYLVNDLKISRIAESHVLELHKIAIADVYPCGGQYRHAAIDTTLPGGPLLPPQAMIQSLVREMLDRINNHQPHEFHLERPAYALWRMCRIHPFAGGNGRTARALCYLIICMEANWVLPGIPSIPATLAARKSQYLNALKLADRAENEGREGQEDLSAMVQLISTAYLKQIKGALKEITDRIREREPELLADEFGKIANEDDEEA